MEECQADNGAIGILFDIEKILSSNKVVYKQGILAKLKRFFPNKIKSYLKERLFPNYKPSKIKIVNSSYRKPIEFFLQTQLDCKDIWGCKLYAGETQATLAGRGKYFCIAFYGVNKIDFNSLRQRILKAKDDCLAVPSMRIVEYSQLQDELLFPYSEINSDGKINIFYKEHMDAD